MIIILYFRNLKCNNEDGWSLYGSDWGCCGNYDGCCTWATSVCYYHDAMCKCCDYGWLICGPDCKPEAECFEGYEENSNQIYEHNTDSRSEKDTNDTWMNNKFETKKNILSEIIHAKKMKNSVLPPKGDKNETIENGKSFPNGKSKNASIKLKYTKYRKNRLTKKLYARDQLMLADQSFKDYVEDGSGETP